ncbi:MAG: hypothetical protein ACI81L_000588 [Verrucomicrobiales bacterium]|jgi:uncharacterized protein (TIGR03083 family)
MEAKIDELGEITSAAERISGLFRSRDLATPIAHLGEWNLRDLADHLGGVHRWAARIINERSMDGPSSAWSKLDGTDLCDWFDSGVEDLVEAFRTNPQGDPCPNFNSGSVKTVAWWSRRQMHETTVHRWDAEHALECSEPIARDVAVDGIDEYLDVFVRTRGKQTLIAPLVLTSSRPSRSWTLTPAVKPGRLDIAEGRSVDVVDELAGEPDKLLLALWGRSTVSEAGLVVSGDPNVAASFAESL